MENKSTSVNVSDFVRATIAHVICIIIGMSISIIGTQVRIIAFFVKW